jgi:transposase
VNPRLSGRRGRPARCLSVQTIRKLYGLGHSFRAIAEMTGIGYGTVRRAFHGLAPVGADIGPEKARARRSAKSKRKFKSAAA